MSDTRRSDGAWDIDPPLMNKQLVSWNDHIRAMDIMAATMSDANKRRWRLAAPHLREIADDLEQSAREARKTR